MSPDDFEYDDKVSGIGLINGFSEYDLPKDLREKIQGDYWTGYTYKKFDTMLKGLDEEYRTTLVNFAKYKIVMFAMAKFTEMETTEQNKVTLYLFNNIEVKM